ncbi:aminotransferase class I/II-fold pyridoxal phosphate-dependent enzyme [Maritalea sp. S77]|uniref:aminotransferase class I/II-fold pyridoxal phosphate-dependent enzyme n=1 Tax=Maritalea sp. S77 TaxID=3415125 RepID=UPI003C7C6979
MQKYCVTNTMTLRKALEVIDQHGKGIAILVDDDGRVERTVTDGDLRRLILSGVSLEDEMSMLPQQNSTIGDQTTTRKDALALMDAKGLDHLPIVDANGHLVDLYDRRTLSKRIFLSAPHMGELERTYIDDAFKTNWIAPLGPNVNGFEQEICDYLGCKAAAATSSGTAALHLALVVLGVERGDVVFCSSLTFVASANPILYQGAEPVFIDSELESWNMCPRALERALLAAKSEDRLPKAIIVVNLYGQSANIDALLDVANQFGVPIIEDAAESLGAKYKGQQSGTFGKLGVYSFNGNKIITTSGGGMLVSDDEDLISRARFLSTQAREPEVHYEHRVVGYNYRMSNILAGVGRGQLRVLDERVAKRRELFDLYVSELSDRSEISWMPEPNWSFSNRWLSVCTIDASKSGVALRELLACLDGELIEARPVWKPLHLQPLFEKSKMYSAGNKNVSEELYNTGICLPSGTSMKEEDIARVCLNLRRCLDA